MQPWQTSKDSTRSSRATRVRKSTRAQRRRHRPTALTDANDGSRRHRLRTSTQRSETSAQRPPRKRGRRAAEWHRLRQPAPSAWRDIGTDGHRDGDHSRSSWPHRGDFAPPTDVDDPGYSTLMQFRPAPKAPTWSFMPDLVCRFRRPKTQRAMTLWSSSTSSSHDAALLPRDPAGHRSAVHPALFSKMPPFRTRT